MRLGWAKTKYSISYYVKKTIYVDGKNKDLVIKRLGSEKYIRETYGVTDAKAWAKEQVQLMNDAEKEDTSKFSIELCAGTNLVINEQRRFNGGYLFLQDIYYELGLHKICRAIAAKYSFNYDLNDILSRLIYTRILYPSSKKSSFEDSGKFIEQPSFELHDIYRALSIMSKESDYIQSRLFKNSAAFQERNTQVIYYDCTNFYFEIDSAEGDKQFGKSKENRPLPIVGMGLFMDSDGIPISFSIYSGNRNEQTTMIPLEKKMLESFDMSKFIVCTDAGLSSATNRVFNSYNGENGMRSYITTQPIKTLKGFLQDWCLSDDEWLLDGDKSGKKYKLSELDSERDRDKYFYKTRWIKEESIIRTDKGDRKKIIEQKLIVSYSIKYRDYQRHVRQGQIERAIKIVASGETIDKKKVNDPKRFIKTDHATNDGELASQTVSYIDTSVIDAEEKYDGFYAVCTNLDDSIESIIRTNKRRWEIEECFRIMKTDFEARPVYLKRQDRILAHFITCFISLIVYRYLEKKLNNKYTIDQILSALQGMDFMKYEGKGYQPVYTRTELTDDLHDAFGFCTSKQIIPIAKMKNICSKTKK